MAEPVVACRESTVRTDLIVVGAGAAGMLAALAARGAIAADGALRAAAASAPRVTLIDGQSRPGAKILISGGGRCNVTNDRTQVDDYGTDRPTILRSVLREFPPAAVRQFFASCGCPLMAEELGKVFPASGRAGDILAALRAAVAGAGVDRVFGSRVISATSDDRGWQLETAGRVRIVGERLIVATGGLSVPATGASGFGLDLARRLGVPVRAPVPALVALQLEEAPAELAGVSVPAIAALQPIVSGGPGTRRPVSEWPGRAAGSLLFTHRGMSGPAILDLSGAWERASRSGPALELTIDFWTLVAGDEAWRQAVEDSGARGPGACLTRRDCPRSLTPEAFWRTVLEPDSRAAGSASGGAGHGIGSLLCRRLPRRLARWLLAGSGVDPRAPVSQADRAARDRIYRAVVCARFPVTGSEGYRKAEVTAGGVLLGELERRSLAWRGGKRVHFCGEVVNVTGRLGGFNFQWAFASGFVAGCGAARAGAGSGRP